MLSCSWQSHSLILLSRFGSLFIRHGVIGPNIMGLCTFAIAIISAYTYVILVNVCKLNGRSNYNMYWCMLPENCCMGIHKKNCTIYKLENGNVNTSSTFVLNYLKLNVAVVIVICICTVHSIWYIISFFFHF